MAPSMLEKMLNRHDKDRKKEEPIPDGPTLNQTINNEEMSKHLGTYLETQGTEGEELAQRLQTGTLTGADVSRLAELRTVHNERMTRVSNLEKACSPENIESFAAGSEQFRGIVEVLGRDKAARMIKSELYNLLEREPGSFDDLYEAWDQIESYKNTEMKELNDRILEQCTNLGVSQADFEAALLIEDPKERRDRLVPKIKNNYGGFKKAWSFMTGSAKRDAKELMGRQADIEAALAQIDGFRGSVGEVLGELTVNNADVLAAYNRELLDKPVIAREEKTSFKEAERAGIPPNKAEVMTDWAAELTSLGLDSAAFGAKTAPEQQVIKDAFKAKQIEKQDKKLPKKSFWQRMFGGVFASFFDKEVEKDLK